VRIAVSILVLLAAAALPARAELSDLRAEVEQLRKQVAQREADQVKDVPIGKVNNLMAAKYSPDAPVKTKDGQLRMAGLLQLWYQSVQKDSNGVIEPAPGNTRNFTEPNSVLDQDTFRIRRAELRFMVLVHENVRAEIMIDPARESNSSFVQPGASPIYNEDLAVGKIPLIQTGTIDAASQQPHLLQDAYINYQGVIPHHDITIGQFKPPAGWEGWHNSGMLDFAERSMITSISNVRDLGVMLSGSWVQDRVQYSVGGFNGSNEVLDNPEIFEAGNRSAKSNDKDLSWRVEVRPVWSEEKWYGKLQLGYARTDGHRGKSDNGDILQDAASGNAINGLGEERTAINRQAAWVVYRPNAEVSGWWFRGEWGSNYARFSATDANFTGATSLDSYNWDGTMGGYTFTPQVNPKPVTASGWYGSTGYKLMDSIWAENLAKGGPLEHGLRNLEFAFRAEACQNIFLAAPPDPTRDTRLFSTKMYTAGVNYYLAGGQKDDFADVDNGHKYRDHDVKLQANYMIVDTPENANYGLRKVNCNTLLISLQVMF